MRPAVGGERRPRLCLVAALASNGVIGSDGRLPWYLPEDLRHFKALTLGHPVIMGRRTWESIGKPLPGRENIVVSRQRAYDAPGARVAASLEESLARCADAPIVFVIGGADLYAAALPIADLLEFTEISGAFRGDTLFPAFDRSAWRETRRETHTSADGLRFDFVRYERVAVKSAAG
jgi:dihydrofolate reductase